jgi:hypothetical protein
LARGAVVVVANRTDGEVQFTLAPEQEKARPYAVASGDLAAIPMAGPADIAFDSGKGQRHYRVEPDAAYYFVNLLGGLELKEIGLAGGQDRPRRPVADRPPEQQRPSAETSRPPARVRSPFTASFPWPVSE